MSEKKKIHSISGKILNITLREPGPEPWGRGFRANVNFSKNGEDVYVIETGNLATPRAKNDILKEGECFKARMKKNNNISLTGVLPTNQGKIQKKQYKKLLKADIDLILDELEKLGYCL